MPNHGAKNGSGEKTAEEEICNKKRKQAFLFLLSFVFGVFQKKKPVWREEGRRGGALLYPAVRD